MTRESILNVFPSNDGDSRLVIAIEQPSDEQSRLVLRQETRSSDVGWFVQSRVAVMPEQVAGLKMALSGNRTHTAQPHSRDAVPTILSFSEAAGQVG